MKLIHIEFSKTNRIKKVSFGYERRNKNPLPKSLFIQSIFSQPAITNVRRFRILLPICVVEKMYYIYTQNKMYAIF